MAYPSNSEIQSLLRSLARRDVPPDGNEPDDTTSQEALNGRDRVNFSVIRVAHATKRKVS